MSALLLLQEENARLRGEYAQADAEASNQTRLHLAAKAEVARLREALERIDSTEYALPAEVRTIARAALGDQTEEAEDE